MSTLRSGLLALLASLSVSPGLAQLPDHPITPLPQGGGPGPDSVVFVRSFDGTPLGFAAMIQDADTRLDPATLRLWLDDQPVTATSVLGPDADGVTRVSYVGPTVLPNHSSHSARVQFNDTATPPHTITHEGAFTTSYQTIPADYATSQFSGTKGALWARVHQMPPGVARGAGDINRTANAEMELQDGLIDPATGRPAANQAARDPVELVMLNARDQEADHAGWFNAGNTPDYPDDAMPNYVVGDNYAIEVIGYAELRKGAYRLVVNSDEGFKLSTGPNGPDVVGLVLGSFDGGRAATLNGDPAPFDVVVEADGVYPLRLAYWEGTGDASVEWYAIDYATGERTLINADLDAAVKTYPQGKGRAYVRKLLPYPGTVGVIPQPTLTFVLVNDLTTVVDGSIRITLDTAELTGLSVVKHQATNTVTWTPAAPFPDGSPHSGRLSYTESNGQTRTIDFNFTIRALEPSDLPANSFWIELEDFDYDAATFTTDGGAAQETANLMPYLGGAYEGLGAVHDVDYHRNDPGPFTDGQPDAWLYRTGIPPEPDGPSRYVPIYANTGEWLDTARPGSRTMLANYALAAPSEGVWYNFTRALPDAVYYAYAALSHADTQPHGLRASLDLVTSGAGTALQSLTRLGAFDGPGTGKQGSNVLLTMRDADGTPASVRLSGQCTLRFNADSGDADYLILAPGATPVAPRILTPPASQSVNAGTDVTFTVVAAGTGPLAYAWRCNDVPLANQAAASLTLTNVGPDHAGVYRVEVSGPGGASVTSPDATLTVAGGAPELSIALNADGSIRLEWTGGGGLQSASSLMGTWSPISGRSPVTLQPTASLQFFRVSR